MQQLVTQFDNMNARSVVATPSCCSSCCCCCCVVTLVVAPIVTSRSLRKTYQENEPAPDPSFWEGASISVENLPADLPAQDASPAPSPNRPPIESILRKNRDYYALSIIFLLVFPAFGMPLFSVIGQILGIGLFDLTFLPVGLIFLIAWGVALFRLYRWAGYKGFAKPILAVVLFVVAFTAEFFVWLAFLIGFGSF